MKTMFDFKLYSRDVFIFFEKFQKNNFYTSLKYLYKSRNNKIILYYLKAKIFLEKFQYQEWSRDIELCCETENMFILKFLICRLGIKNIIDGILVYNSEIIDLLNCKVYLRCKEYMFESPYLLGYLGFSSKEIKNILVAYNIESLPLYM